MNISTPQEFQAYLYGLRVACQKEMEDIASSLLGEISVTFGKFMANYIAEQCLTNDDEEYEDTDK